MPIDLTPAAAARPYPKQGPRLVPWLLIWVAFATLGAALVILFWPVSWPAKGFGFWFCAAGIPSLAYLLALSLVRLPFELHWFRAYGDNVVRQEWKDKKQVQAQQPLQVLGIGYCLPVGGQTLASVVAAGQSVQKAQKARKGPSMVVHSRFDEGNVSDLPVAHSFADNEAQEAESRQVATVTLKIGEALVPLAASLTALSQYGPVFAPVVRVLARDEVASLRLQQVRDALAQAGLSQLECRTEPVSDRLMVADAWLDARDRRPLLVVAVEWYEQDPPAGSTEGCVAVLLNAGYYKVPEPVTVLGKLHRPLKGEARALDHLLMNALKWGRTESAAVQQAWISSPDSDHDRAWPTACKAATLERIAQTEAQHRLDRLVGNAGLINAWMSIAAAVESHAQGPQLIVDGNQAAILYVFPSVHDDTDQ
ncbi:hypothetical protein [Cupriavidus basilensis]|uniref:hypothetical protein n=1 Tax=Cupriavidus basilensis TaxID=68895 RepID=UPI000750A994|nr:hypothetical protein [Cupriavidus basilensis]